MKTKQELDEVMKRMGFRPDLETGGYLRNSDAVRLRVSEIQAREALQAAERDEAWTEDDIEPLSESLARTLIEAGIG